MRSHACLSTEPSTPYRDVHANNLYRPCRNLKKLAHHIRHHRPAQLAGPTATAPCEPGLPGSGERDAWVLPGRRSVAASDCAIKNTPYYMCTEYVRSTFRYSARLRSAVITGSLGEAGTLDRNPPSPPSPPPPPK